MDFFNVGDEKSIVIKLIRVSKHRLIHAPKSNFGFKMFSEYLMDYSLSTNIMYHTVIIELRHKVRTVAKITYQMDIEFMEKSGVAYYFKDYLRFLKVFQMMDIPKAFSK